MPYRTHKAKEKKAGKIQVVCFTIFFALIAYSLDSLVDYWFFNEGDSFLELLILDLSKHEIYMRFFVLGLFLLFGIVVYQIVGRLTQADIELSESEAKYRTLIETAPDAILTADADSGMLIDANHKAEELTEWSKEDLMSMHFSELHPLEKKDHYQNIFDSVKSGETSWEEEQVVVRKNGQRVPVKISATLNHFGGRKMVLGILRNIENEKKRKAELEASRDQAEKASEFKSVILSMISHDIRTPITAILGYTDLLKRQAQGKEQKEFLGYVSSGGKMLLNLVDQVLDFSKIEAGRFEKEVKPVNMSDLIEEVGSVMKYLIRGKGLGLQLIVDPKIDQPVMLDSVRLRQVLINLLSNALKFTEKGSIVLAVDEKHRNERRIDLQIRVEDTGMGIPSELMESIFQPFFQVTGNTTEQGHGLGLFITKRLVEAMDGVIHVDSHPGKGSCFLIDLKDLQLV